MRGEGECCPGRARRRAAGTRATRGGAGRRHPRRRPAPWRPGRAPRCRARRAGRARGPSAPGRRGRASAASAAEAAGGVDEDSRDAGAVSLGLPPRVPRERVGQRLALDEVEGGPVVGHGQLGSSCAFASVASVAARCTSTVTSGDSWYRPLRVAGREQRRRPLRRRPWRAGRRRRCSGQRLGRGVGVGRAEDAGAQPVAGDDVGLVEGEVGDELDGAPGAVGWELLGQPVEAGRDGQQPHVDRRRG